MLKMGKMSVLRPIFGQMALIFLKMPKCTSFSWDSTKFKLLWGWIGVFLMFTGFFKNTMYKTLLLDPGGVCSSLKWMSGEVEQ